MGVMRGSPWQRLDSPLGGSSFLWSSHSGAGFPLCRLETRIGQKPVGWMCSGVTHDNTSVNTSADSATHSEDTTTSGLRNHVHPSAAFPGGGFSLEGQAVIRRGLALEQGRAQAWEHTWAA